MLIRLIIAKRLMMNCNQHPWFPDALAKVQVCCIYGLIRPLMLSTDTLWAPFAHVFTYNIIVQPPQHPRHCCKACRGQPDVAHDVAQPAVILSSGDKGLSDAAQAAAVAMWLAGKWHSKQDHETGAETGSFCPYEEASGPHVSNHWCWQPRCFPVDKISNEWAQLVIQHRRHQVPCNVPQSNAGHVRICRTAHHMPSNATAWLAPSSAQTCCCCCCCGRMSTAYTSASSTHASNSYRQMNKRDLIIQLFPAQLAVAD